MVKRLTEIHTMAFRNSCFALVLLLGPFALFGQTPAVDQTPPDTQNATQASSTDKTPAQKPAAPAPKPRKEIAGGKTAQEIANEANNPAAPVTLIQFRDILLPNATAQGVVPGLGGASGTINSLQMQPVVPIGPFKSFPYVQLMKISMPLLITIPSGGTAYPAQFGVSGVGDLQVFDLITIKQSWGRWGFGPALVFPTASANPLGNGKYQAGPAAALVYAGIKNFTVGAVMQNPISYAGSPNRPGVNNMIITPTCTFNLEDGWFVGMSDYNWSFNWENGGALTFPLGVQVGKVLKLGKQPFSLSAEVGGVAARPANTPNPGWIFGFELSPIFNWHLGPGEKVRLRGKN
jgi:hypothetical protein